MELLTFPVRAFIQGHENGRLPPESTLVVEELQSRSIPVIVKTTEEINSSPWPLTDKDLVVGDFTWTRMALTQLGKPFPPPPDYPECLRYLLHRKVWTSTLGEINANIEAEPEKTIFIKPAEDTKAFSGLIVSVDWMGYLLDQFSPSLSVLCSELVEMISEYRVYVVDGSIRRICHYKGPTDIPLDIAVVESAVQTLFGSEEGKELTGCGMDFAVMKFGEVFKTGLVEVNDGYSLGAYEGISGKDYTDMLIARWAKLVQQA